MTVAYVDDVTLILRSPQEISTVQKAIGFYEQATGVRINYGKPKALALGGWIKTIPLMGVTYYPHIRIFGVTFGKFIRTSTVTSWDNVTAVIRTQATEIYCSELLLHQRIHHANIHLMAKAWFLAELLPPPVGTLRQITTILSWCLWRGRVFRVPLSTLHRNKRRGGWGLVHLEAKCRNLLLCRLDALCERKGSLTAQWLTFWGLRRRCVNLPPMDKRLTKFPYVLLDVLDTAYIPPQRVGESHRTYRRRTYETFQLLL